MLAHRASSSLARGRIVEDPGEVIEAAPDLIIGSWCGKHFRPERVAARPGWQDIPAVANHRIHEIKSAVILTPAPVAIREGLPALVRLFADWAETEAAR